MKQGIDWREVRINAAIGALQGIMSASPASSEVWAAKKAAACAGALVQQLMEGEENFEKYVETKKTKTKKAATI